MKLPDRLDYVEVNVPDEDHPEREAYPEVFCTMAGCGWTYGASWDEFATDSVYDTDWDRLHPAHDAQMAFADVVEMEPANNLPPNVR